MTSRRIFAALAASAAAAIATPTWAYQSSALATLSGLTFSVTDLNPDDGIEAGFSFAGMTSIGAGAYSLALGGAMNYGPLVYQLQPLSEIFARSDTASIVHGSTMFGTAGQSGNLLYSSGTTTAFMSSAHGHATFQSGYIRSFNDSFSVNPNTQLTVTGLATLHAAVNGTCDAVLYACDVAWADASLTFGWLTDLGVSGPEVYSTEVGVRANAALQPTTVELLEQSLTQELQLSLYNRSNETQYALLQAVTYAGASYDWDPPPPVTPIPEPSTYALMLAGLAAVVGRRRLMRAS